MKNKFLLSLVIMSCVAFTACGHEHTFSDATCTTPKTCTECGEVEGTSLGHTFTDATCTTAKTCTVCGETEGNVAEHTWVEANCTEPKKCSVCSTTEGDALGHKWLEATTEAPKTCENCGLTEGEPLPVVEEKPPVQEEVTGRTAADYFDEVAKQYGLTEEQKNAEIDAISKRLNMEREDMLKLSEEKFIELLNNSRNGGGNNNNGGGNSNSGGNNNSGGGSNNSGDNGNGGDGGYDNGGLPPFDLGTGGAEGSM